MTGNRSEKKVLMFAACCAAIVFGGYMTFFHKESEEVSNYAEIQTGEFISDKGMDYQGKELPDTENESADELYAEDGITINEIYFTNTKLLDEGNMPLETQIVLVSEVQQFLDRSGYKDVTELYISDESYIETEEKISYICFMNGYKEALQIEYIFGENSLKYYILPDGTDTGVTNE